MLQSILYSIIEQVILDVSAIKIHLRKRKTHKKVLPKRQIQFKKQWFPKFQFKRKVDPTYFNRIKRKEQMSFPFIPQISLKLIPGSETILVIDLNHNLIVVVTNYRWKFQVNTVATAREPSSERKVNCSRFVSFIWEDVEEVHPGSVWEAG